MATRSLALVALAGFVVAACGAPPNDETGEITADPAPVCPPDAPDCDGVDEPCVPEEEQEEGLGAPASSPLGLTDPKTSAGKFRVWPQGRVPYKISSTVGSTTKTRLLAAMNEWRTKSSERVRFVKATASDTAYLNVTAGSPKVSPHVGYRAGKVSTMYLRNPEYITVIRHELGHVLGFHHEHKRSDRASYIQVLTANIVNTPSCEYQFSKCNDCELVKSYNVKSVMHYRTYRDLASCRVNGNAVLLDKDGSKIDHEWVITSADLAALAVLYPASTSGSGGAGGSAGAPATGGAPSDGGLAGSAGSGNVDEDGGDDGGIDEWDAAMGGAAGAAGSWSTAGTSPISAGGQAGGAQAQQTRVERVESGCGCRTAPSERTRDAWLLALALAVAITRRGRRAISS
jgi:MYXO-CTERM domain-containing protein